MSFPVSDAGVKQEGVLAWINGEAQKLFRQLRAFANFLSWDYATVTTTGDGATTTIWTSPAMPNNACWTILVIISGVSTSGAAQRAGTGRAVTFESTAGTVAQVSSATQIWVHESDPAIGVAFSENTSTRTVSVGVLDNGTSPMRFSAVIITCESLPS